MGKQIKMSNKSKGVGGNTGAISLEEGWKAFIKRNKLKNLSDATKRNYEEKVYRKFLYWVIDDKQINDVPMLNQELLQEYIEYLSEQDMTPNSVNSYHRAVRTFLNHMMELKYLDHYKIEVPKDTSRVVKCYADEQIERLCKRPDTDSFAEFRNYVVCNILAGTGMRGGSLVNILNEDVDADNNTLILRHTKTGVIQYIPITQQLMTLIKEYQEIVDGKPDERLIVTYINKPFNVRALNKEVRKYANARGIYVEKYLHSFRYWYGVSLAKANVGAFTIMKLMGHNNIRTSQGYIDRAGLDISDKVETINPLANLSKDKVGHKIRLK
jgi:integrase/recombinase XerD